MGKDEGQGQGQRQTEPEQMGDREESERKDRMRQQRRVASLAIQIATRIDHEHDLREAVDGWMNAVSERLGRIILFTATIGESLDHISPLEAAMALQTYANGQFGEIVQILEEGAREREQEERDEKQAEQDRAELLNTPGPGEPANT